MKKKVIWYCTGCHFRCAVKIFENIVPYRSSKDDCLLYTPETCKTIEVRPDWRKHEPDAK